MKNQKHLVYSYSNLIRGDRFSASIHSNQISKLEREKKALQRNGKPVTPEIIEGLAYNRSQLAYFNDEISRYQRVQAVCGDPTTLVR